MVPICSEWWCTEANEATQTHCHNPVAPAYLIWARYAHGRQRRCQEDPVGLPSGRLEKTTGPSPHHMAQHHPTGSETSPSYAPRSSRFVSEPPSVEDDVDVWCYAIVSCMPETTTTTLAVLHCSYCCHRTSDERHHFAVADANRVLCLFLTENECWFLEPYSQHGWHSSVISLMTEY